MLQRLLGLLSEILHSVLEYSIIEEYETFTCVCGCHEYQRVWKAAVGKNFASKRKCDKIQGILDGITDGHLPRKISRICYYFII